MPWNHGFIRRDSALALAKAQLGDPLRWGEVRVAHLDTGYSFHPAMGFSNRTGLRPGDTSAIIVEDGGDFFHPSRGTAFDPLDPVTPFLDIPIQDPGHGTFSGTVMAGDAGAAFQGAVPGLPILSMRVTEGSLLIDERAAAAGRALRKIAGPGTRGPLAPVVNISLGWITGHSGLSEGLDACYEKGVIVIAAAGQMIGQVVYPARYQRAIAVAGIKRQQPSGFGVYWAYDDYSYVDVWAPAAGLTRGDVSSPISPNPPPQSYVYDYKDRGVEGTTYAAAQVSAAAALWCLFHGTALDVYPKPWMKVEAFRQVLLTHNQTSVFSSQLTRKLKQQGNNAYALKMDRLLQAPLPAASDLKKAGT